MRFSWALGVESVGVALVIGCSLSPLPIVSSASGSISAADLSWGEHGDPYSLYLDREYAIDGVPDPAGPGPSDGQTVQVDYFDTAERPVVLDVIAGNTTYVTGAGKQLAQNRLLYNAALLGLLLGIALSVAGAVLAVRAARLAGADSGAIAVGMAPLSMLALVDLIGLWSGLPVLAKTTELAALVWIAASIVGLVAARIGRDDESPAYARGAGMFLLIGNGVLVFAWIGGFLSALNRAMF